MHPAPVEHFPPSPELIERELDRILASTPFSKSDRMCRLLRYLVDNSIHGRAEKLKEYAIGVDVFDKDASFDPRIDTNVRTEARRLRAKLAEYYESEGATDPLRIELPRGGYALLFEQREIPPEPRRPPSRSRRWPLFALILASVLGCGGIVYIYNRLAKPQAQSLAVLPFVDLSPDRSNEYFSDGLTEELIDALTRVPGLRVVARTSAFQFKGKTEDIREIGRRLNVGVVLEGSVRKAGNQVRITAQLDSTADGYHLWSHTWDRELSHVFALQEEIAEAIAANLRAPSRTAQGDRLVRSSTRNLEAYNLYLQGRYYWSKRSEDALNQAIQCFERAVERDPGYALAYTGMADAYNVMPAWSNTPPKPFLRKAKEAALKALSLDNSLAEAHTSLAYAVQHLDWDWEGGDRELRRAIELNPGYPLAHAFYSQWFRERGRLDEALAEMRRAREADPTSPLMRASNSLLLYLSRRYPEALEEARQTIQMDGKLLAPHRILGAVHIQQGLYPEAIEDLQQALKLQNDSYCLGRLGYLYARTGRANDAWSVVRRMEAERARRYMSAYHIAVVFFGLGDLEQVFAWLDKAYQDSDPDVMMLKAEPLFDGLRADPRYTALLRKMRLES